MLLDNYALPLFCIAFGLMLFATYLLGRLGKEFFTNDVVIRPFSMLDVEFAATPKELYNTMHGMYLLPPTKMKKAVSSFSKSLWVDTLLYIPFTYSSIFLMCFIISERVLYGGKFFLILGILQIVPLVLDLIENLFLWSKLKLDIKEDNLTVFKRFRLLQLFKWGIALFGTVCSLSVALSLWLSGHYKPGQEWYCYLFLGEILAFFLLVFLSKRADESVA